MVWIRKPKNKKSRYFTIHGPWCSIIKKYIDIRPANTEKDRFLLNYQDGVCIRQGIGKQKIGQMSCRIAEFLGLPDAEGYTGHSFRRSSASLFANTGAGMDAVKNLGGWESTKVAEGYVKNSLAYKKRTGSTISATLTGETLDLSASSSPIVSGTGHKKRKVALTSTIVSSASVPNVPTISASSIAGTVDSCHVTPASSSLMVRGVKYKKRNVPLTSTTTSIASVSTIPESFKASTGVSTSSIVPKSIVTSTIVSTSSVPNVPESSVTSSLAYGAVIPYIPVPSQEDSSGFEFQNTAGQCVASKGYLEGEDDYIDDSALMDVMSGEYVASQGYIQTGDDSIEDSALLQLVEQDKSEQQLSKANVDLLQNILGRHFNFNNCSVTFNFKN